MTTMNNEDPADPSVHEQRGLPEPAAWRVYFPDEQREELASSLDELCDDLTNCAYDEPEPLYTADQMREAIAAGRERAEKAERMEQLLTRQLDDLREQQVKPPKWWTCQTHGAAQSNAWGCPECVREMRSELVAHDALIAEVFTIAQLGVLPDGDIVDTPTLLWAEGWMHRLTEKEQPK